MTGTIPQRNLLTTDLVSFLGVQLGTALITGRGIAPPAGGWSDGQPGHGTFQPYVVVKTGQGRPSLPEVIGRDNRVRWQMAYRLSTASSLESTVDRWADVVRKAFLSYRGQVVPLGDASYEVEKADINAMGATVANNATNPPAWDVTDDVSVWLSKVRA